MAVEKRKTSVSGGRQVRVVEVWQVCERADDCSVIKIISVARGTPGHLKARFDIHTPAPKPRSFFLVDDLDLGDLDLGDLALALLAFDALSD